MAQSSKLPANPIGLYIAYWNPNGRVDDYHPDFNYLLLFHAPGDGDGTAGTFTYIYPSNVTNAQHRTDIQDARTAGKLVVLSVGGAGGQVYITNQTRADAMVQSFKDENDVFGGFTRGSGNAGTTLYVDGIDLNNFEGGGSDPVFLSDAITQLKAYYGADNFLCSAPPAGFGLNIGGQGEGDRDILGQLYFDDNLDWFSPQYYDPSNLNTLTRKREGVDWYGATFTYNGNSITIPKGHIGVGMSLINTGLAYPDNDPASRNSAAEAISHYNTLVTDGREPKGGFLWGTSVNVMGDFAPAVSSVMDNNAEGPPPNPEIAATKYGVVNANAVAKVGYGQLVADVATYRGYSIPEAAGTLSFSEDFESGIPGGFDSVSTQVAGATATLDTSSTVDGVNSVKFEASATGGVAVARYDHGSDITEGYYQFRMFIPTAFAFGVSNYAGLFAWLDSTDATRAYYNFEGAAFDLTYNGTDTPGYTNTTLDLPDNTIFKVELYINKSATGSLKVWIDNDVEGSPDYDSGTIDLSGNDIRKFQVGMNYAPEAVTDGFYIDSVKFDEAFIGNRT